jgi:hypothetical protein
MTGLKESNQAVAGDVLVSLAGFAPPLLLALGSRVISRTPQAGVHTGITNVPGPQRPVQTLGRRLLESFPYVPLLGPVRVVVAIFSYDGGLYFGISGDADTAADVDILSSGIERGIAELTATVEPRPNAPQAPRPTRVRAKDHSTRRPGDS